MTETRKPTPPPEDLRLQAFLAALKLPPAEREAGVRERLRGDPEGQLEVLEWLRAADQQGPIPGQFDHVRPPSGKRDYIGATPTPDSKYGEGKRITTGGMGSILFVLDPVLRRTVCMKVARGEERRGEGDFEPPPDALVERLVREAAITGRLEHPGIVPVYELGQQENGRVYFIMQRVQGEDLADALRRHRTGDPAWTLPRLVDVLLRVCETVAFAHDRGVIHRDLKPANLRLGEFGQVYVLDWGLARVLDLQRFRRGVSEEGLEPLQAERPVSEFALKATYDLSSPGHALGTPGYMAPEQARGDQAATSYAADVYSLGSVLYEMLAGRRPYLEPKESPRAGELIRRLEAGPPAPLARAAPHAPPELVAICDKAMARDPAERYADVRALAQDLRRFSEGRAVQAYRTGAWIEARKWVQRNRALASASAAALVLLVAGSSGVALSQRARAHAERRRADESATRTLHGELALIPLSAGDSAARLRAWLQRAEDVASRTADYTAQLAALRARGAALPPAQADALPDSRQGLIELHGKLLAMAQLAVDAPTAEPAYDQQVLQDLHPLLAAERRFEQSLAGEPREFRFEDDAAQIEHDALAALVRRERELVGPELGAVARAKARLSAVESLPQAASDARWEACRRSVADPSECPAYGGLALAPQRGLVPLRRDPHSGLWEFLHVLSGDEPRPSPDGGYELDPDDGIVLVLVPGGSALLGSREELDPQRHDDGIEECERPLLEVRLRPFLLAKYELTQAQWHRMRGDWPSYLPAGSFPQPRRVSLLHPVESVRVEESLEALRPWGLTLPTEAQWEWCARSGEADPRSTARTWWGADASGAEARANFKDETYRASDRSFAGPGHDGWYAHCPVGSFPPNPWGFCEILGNVSEWCLDWRVETYAVPDRVTSVRQPGDGLLTPKYFAHRVSRGGAFALSLASLRFSAREERMPNEIGWDIGARAARPLDP